MKKIFIKISLFVFGVLLVLTPLGIFALHTHNQPHIYAKTYYAALVDKVNYLKSVRNEKKIVLIGGSNVAFGFSSELLEQEFPEYKVVNFGLYANLGTKIMMDLALEYIRKDDMVFLIPEINSQSTSLYFNAMSTLKAIEDDMSLIWKLPKENRDAVIGTMFDFSSERGKYSSPIETEGVYQRKNFNKYGDILYEDLDDDGIPYRAANRMALYYDTTMMVNYSYKLDDKFIDYVNSYNNSIISKKATLYYSFSPVNEKSVLSEDDVVDYYWNIRKKLSCKVVGNPSEYIIDPHYFYDSNFHLNDSGAILRTYLLAQDIYRDIYLSAEEPSIVIPEIPPYPNEGDIGDETDVLTVFRYICSDEEASKLTETTEIVVVTTLQKYMKNDIPRPLTGLVDEIYIKEEITDDLDIISVEDALRIIDDLDDGEETTEKYAIKGRIILIRSPYTSDSGYVTFTMHEDSDTSTYFEYNNMEDSLLISEIVNEHKNDQAIVLPQFANGKRVIGIDKNAFTGCTAINNLIISKNIKILIDGCFGNCPSLTKAYIETHNPSDIIVSYTGSLINGAADGFKFYIHNDCLTAFSTNYYWGNYSEYFVGY